jgi:sulfur-oxidizing protein SoxX
MTWISAALAAAFLCAGMLDVAAQGSPASAPSPAAISLAVFQIVEQDGVPGIPQSLSGKAGDSKEGAKVVANRRLGNCLSCHQISDLRTEQFHGEVGPSLDGVGSRWKAEALRLIIVNPKKVFTDATVMPAFHRTDGLNRVRSEFQGKPILTAQQVEDVVAYLLTLK